MSALFAFN